VRRGRSAERRHSPRSELHPERFETWSARRTESRVLARLCCAVGSLAAVAYVCIATGRTATSLAIYILAVAAAALTLKGAGWHLVPALPQAVSTARARLGRRLRHGTPRAARIAEAREGHGG